MLKKIGKNFIEPNRIVLTEKKVNEIIDKIFNEYKKNNHSKILLKNFKKSNDEIYVRNLNEELYSTFNKWVKVPNNKQKVVKEKLKKSNIVLLNEQYFQDDEADVLEDIYKKSKDIFNEDEYMFNSDTENEDRIEKASNIYEMSKMRHDGRIGEVYNFNILCVQYVKHQAFETVYVAYFDPNDFFAIDEHRIARKTDPEIRVYGINKSLFWMLNFLSSNNIIIKSSKNLINNHIQDGKAKLYFRFSGNDDFERPEMALKL